jgi:hypothetical protein
MSPYICQIPDRYIYLRVDDRRDAAHVRQQPIDIINYSYPRIVNQLLFTFGLPSKLPMSIIIDIISLLT